MISNEAGKNLELKSEERRKVKGNPQQKTIEDFLAQKLAGMEVGALNEARKVVALYLTEEVTSKA